ncbi:MAG: YicC family protein [Defluviitaleaceae bacterium]|nr:YicC family protein [Defluviitaleaceae bacterium]
MIKSMSGYGRAEEISADWICLVELKAVNHRYFDAVVHMPSIMNAYEDAIRKMLAKNIARGRIDAAITINCVGNSPTVVNVNTTVANSYVRAFNTLIDAYRLQDVITLDLLASKEDIFTVDKTIPTTTRDEIWQILELALSNAIDNLNVMRATEGDALKRNILEKCEYIIEDIQQLKTKLPEVAIEHEKRLRMRIKNTLEHISSAKLDENRVLTEIAAYANRMLIDEEIVRLESHIHQLYETLNGDETLVGRKIDFLVQEMNREVNTIASKAGSIVISKLVIDIKTEIEKIREQVQNVE